MLKDLQEQLLTDLGRASRVFPDPENGLDKARPISQDIETEVAYAFLRQSAPLLKQNGFVVLLPSWWHRPKTGLGINLILEDFTHICVTAFQRPDHSSIVRVAARPVAILSDHGPSLTKPIQGRGFIELQSRSSILLPISWRKLASLKPRTWFTFAAL